MDLLERFEQDRWDAVVSPHEQRRALESLEGGRVVYFPQLDFPFQAAERALLSRQWDMRADKNISYAPDIGLLRGVRADLPDRALLVGLMQRFADTTKQFLRQLLPTYGPQLSRARTSFRPVEIAGRPSSYRKDDTRLHVDAFPSRPTGSARILRVFSNVNPHRQGRAWRLGEPFPEYARRFAPRIRPPFPGSATLLRLFRITKGYRTLYDHYMLRLHDLGKADVVYQRQAPQMAFDFPAGSTWIVFTDQVVHAAHRGQHLLEQTFHLPVAVLAKPERSPLCVLERLTGTTLTANALGGEKGTASCSAAG